MPDPKKAKHVGGYGPTHVASNLKPKDIQGSISLPRKNVDYKRAAAASADYQKSRKDDSYLAIKLPGGGTVDDKLHKAPVTGSAQQITDFKTGIKTALTLPKETIDKITAFKVNIEALEKVIAQNPLSVTANQVVNKLAELKSTFVDDMKAQQAKEITALDQVFTAQKTEIQAIFGVSDDPAFNTLKTQFVDDLKAEHKKQLEAFEKPVVKTEEEAHKAIEMSLRTINQHQTTLRYREEGRTGATLAVKEFFRYTPKQEADAIQKQQEENKKKAQTEADAEAAKRNGGTAPTKMSNIVPKKPDVSLRDIDMSKIEARTLAGRKLKMTANGYSMEVSSLSKFGILGGDLNAGDMKALTTDIRSLAERIRAQGHDEIEFTIEHSDQESAFKLAEIAYTEALKTGFSDDKISVVITIDGKKQTLKKADLEGRIDSIVLKEAKNTGTQTTNAFKAALKEVTKDKNDLGTIDEQMDEVKKNTTTP